MQKKEYESKIQELVTLLEASKQLNSNLETGEVLESILLHHTVKKSALIT